MQVLLVNTLTALVGMIKRPPKTVLARDSFSDKAQIQLPMMGFMQEQSDCDGRAIKESPGWAIFFV
jgi:hypothetical protein